MAFKYSLTILSGLVLIAISAVASVPAVMDRQPGNPAIQISFAADKEGLNRLSSINCEGKLFAVIQAPHWLKGRHILRGRWFSPQGQLQDESSFETEILPSAPPPYFWLNVEGSQKSILDEFSFGGDYGSQNPFDGTWAFELFLDGVLMAREPFTMKCINE